MLVGSGEFVDLGYFGFRNFAREYTTYTFSARMYVQHYLGCTFAVKVKECFKHNDHKVHRREVIVEQDHLVKRRTHYLRARLLHGEAGMVFGLLVGSLGHEKTIGCFQTKYTPALWISTPKMMPDCLTARGFASPVKLSE